MENNMKSFLISLLFILCFISVAQSAVVDVATCELAAVQTAVTNAARGDTIRVPYGECTWSGRLNIKRAMRLVGNGTKITLANTATTPLLTSDWNDDCGLNLEYSGAAEHIVYKTENAQLDQDAVFEITGFDFIQSTAKVSVIAIINGTPYYPLRNIKIHDNIFHMRTDADASIWSPVFGAHGLVYGVFYKNEIYTKKPYFHISGSNNMDINGINDGSCNTQALGYWTWKNGNTYTPGSLDQMVFEDNIWYFNTTTPVHMGGITHGGKGPTIRYNSYYNSSTTGTSQGGHDLHGAYRGKFGPLGAEVYGNYWEISGAYGVVMLHTRGGRNTVHNNLTIRNNGTTAQPAVSLIHECDECKDPEFSGRTDYVCQAGISTKVDAECAGKYHCSFDNEPPMISSTYLFQNRYGADGTGLANASAGHGGGGSTTTSCACKPYTGAWTNTTGTIYWAVATDAVEYVRWNSTILTEGTSTSPSLNQWYWTGTRLYVNVGANPTTGTLCFMWYLGWAPVENAQFWQDSTSCSPTGTCSSGVGCGSVAPTGNCTKGVGYWQTNQSCNGLTTADVGAGGDIDTKRRVGTLWKCTATNVWTPYYTPAEYPHPLRGAGDTQSGQLSLPTACSGADCTTPLACTVPDESVVIGVTATDNIGITGVKCCLENGSTCVPATTYENMSIVLSLLSGTAINGVWGTTVTNACDDPFAYNCKGTDAAGNITPNIVNSYDMESGSDITDPTLSTQSLGVLGRTLTLVFSEPVRKGAGYLDSQWTFTVDGTPVDIECPVTAGWDTNTLVCQVSECVPSTAVLTLDYAQPGVGLGIVDQSDNLFTIGTAASVTNGSEQSCGASFSLFNQTDTPSHSVYPWGAGTNGVRFKSATQGTLEQICFYKDVAMDGETHSGGVWDEDRNLLGSLVFTGEAESGYICQALETSVNILADTYYRVGVHFPRQRAYTNNFFNSAFTSGDGNLLVDANSGGFVTYGASLAFPADLSYNPGRNWWVDFVMSFADETGPWQMTVSNVSEAGAKCVISDSGVIDDGNSGEVEVTTSHGWKATFSGCGAGSVVQSGHTYTYTTAAITANCTVEVTCSERHGPGWGTP
jgi:hypothetical protein